MNLDANYLVFSFLVFSASFFAMRVNMREGVTNEKDGPMSEGCLIFLIAAGIIGYRFDFSLADHVFNLVVNTGIISLSLLLFKHCREIAVRGGYQTLVIFSLIISFFCMALLQLVKKLVS
jgi:hypothetical protein